MRRMLALTTVVLGLVPTGAAADQSRNDKPRLRLVAGAVLAVRGAHFVPGERVKVTVTVGRRLAKEAVVEGRGSFAVRFQTSFDRCSSSLRVQAVGNRGSLVLLKLPPFMCPPRL